MEDWGSVFKLTQEEMVANVGKPYVTSLMMKVLAEAHGQGVRQIIGP